MPLMPPSSIHSLYMKIELPLFHYLTFATRGIKFLQHMRVHCHWAQIINTSARTAAKRIKNKYHSFQLKVKKLYLSIFLRFIAAVKLKIYFWVYNKKYFKLKTNISHVSQNQKLIAKVIFEFIIRNNLAVACALIMDLNGERSWRDRVH